MKNEKVNWGQSSDSVARLTALLQPLRSRHQVAGLMGVSVTLVCKLEISALSKVTEALMEFDNARNHELNEQYEEMEG